MADMSDGRGAVKVIFCPVMGWGIPCGRNVRLAGDVFHVRVVEVISNQGIAQIFHMDTDLMGAAGFQLKGDQAVPIFFFTSL